MENKITHIRDKRIKNALRRWVFSRLKAHDGYRAKGPRERYVFGEVSGERHAGDVHSAGSYSGEILSIAFRESTREPGNGPQRDART